MSKQDDVKASESSQKTLDPHDEELDLRIDLRFRLDEIAKFEGEALRSKPQPEPSLRELVGLAERIYEARRTRERVFNQNLFGEPAWDMLLALYFMPKRGEFLTVTGLSHAASVPMTTGLRWQGILTDQGLIERGPKGVDARMQFMGLTQLGRLLLERYLRRLYHYGVFKGPWAQ